MELKINGKTVELQFGVRFVRELDKHAGLQANGVSFGLGLTKTLPALDSYDPAALADVIYSAGYAAKPMLTQQDVDDYIDSLKPAEMEKVFDTLLPELKSSNAVGLAVKKMKA
jgi:hypothetical protein